MFCIYFVLVDVKYVAIEIALNTLKIGSFIATLKYGNGAYLHFKTIEKNTRQIPRIIKKNYFGIKTWKI